MTAAWFHSHKVDKIVQLLETEQNRGCWGLRRRGEGGRVNGGGRRRRRMGARFQLGKRSELFAQHGAYRQQNGPVH